MDDVLVQGLLVGGVYALIALGFVLVFKSSLVLNLAHGQMIAVLAYFLYHMLASWGLSDWIGILLIIPSGAILGFLMERLAVRPLLGQPFLSLLLMTVLFRYTKVGLSMRVVAADHEVAQSLGIRVKRVFSLSWAISGAFAAVCGVLVGMVFTVTPTMGELTLGKGLPVLLLGGLNSIPGPVVGGLLIGLCEAPGSRSQPGLKEIVPWVVMLVILLIRPYGLFGERRIERIS